MKRRLTVVENADDCLIDATELYAEVDWSIEALGKQIRLVDTCLHRRCIMRGKGQYLDIVDCNTAAQHNFGLAVMGQPKFKLFVGNKCGHVQVFCRLNGPSMSAWPQ